MLLRTWVICFFEWVRAFRGWGLRDWGATWMICRSCFLGTEECCEVTAVEFWSWVCDLAFIGQLQAQTIAAKESEGQVEVAAQSHTGGMAARSLALYLDLSIHAHSGAVQETI